MKLIFLALIVLGTGLTTEAYASNEEKTAAVVQKKQSATRSTSLKILKKVTGDKIPKSMIASSNQAKRTSNLAGAAMAEEAAAKNKRIQLTKDCKAAYDSAVNKIKTIQGINIEGVQQYDQDAIKDPEAYLTNLKEWQSKLDSEKLKDPNSQETLALKTLNFAISACSPR